MWHGKMIAAAAIAGGIAGCGTLDDSVVFVTKTSLGIDADGTPPNLSLAYDRTEGYFGPRYDNGAVPPVVSKIATDGGIFNRNISQIYATGLAARKLADASNTEPGPTTLSGSKKLMFFGTGTTVGLKVGFTAQAPNSFVLGYRRKEFSYIPLGQTETNGVKSDTYPSVMGMFQTNIEASAADKAQFGLAQFFATGSAAEKLAELPAIRDEFQEAARDAFAAYRRATGQQTDEALKLLRCVIQVEDAKLAAVWKNAGELKLFHDPKVHDQLKGEKDPNAARGLYSDNIGITAGADAAYTGRLMGHRVYVCGLLAS